MSKEEEMTEKELADSALRQLQFIEASIFNGALKREEVREFLDYLHDILSRYHKIDRKRLKKGVNNE